MPVSNCSAEESGCKLGELKVVHVPEHNVNPRHARIQQLLIATVFDVIVLGTDFFVDVAVRTRAVFVKSTLAHTFLNEDQNFALKVATNSLLGARPDDVKVQMHVGNGVADVVHSV